MEEKIYDKDGNASHYDDQDIRTIDKMHRIWGTFITSKYCIITAFKYRERLNKKNSESIEQELIKISWYERKAKELENKIGTKEEIKWKDEK